MNFQNSITSQSYTKITLLCENVFHKKNKTKKIILIDFGKKFLQVENVRKNISKSMFGDQFGMSFFTC